MKAYKATDENMQCREFQFEMDTEFTHDGGIELCSSGFHFCKDLNDVFKYYRFTPFHRFFEVEIPDDADVIHGDNKSVTNKIKFIRELSLDEIKTLTDDTVYIDVDGGYVTNKNKYYFGENNKPHRVDGPAIVEENGDQYWYQNGFYHREDGPAIILANGDQYWYQNDKPHRLDGPAMIYKDGTQKWCQNGLLHRVDGPASVYLCGEQHWYQNGKLHREDGPAIVYANGIQEFWINGVFQNESL